MLRAAISSLLQAHLNPFKGRRYQPCSRCGSSGSISRRSSGGGSSGGGSSSSSSIVVVALEVAVVEVAVVEVVVVEVVVVVVVVVSLLYLCRLVSLIALLGFTPMGWMKK